MSYEHQAAHLDEQESHHIHEHQHHDHFTEHEHSSEHVCSTTCDHHHASQHIDFMNEPTSAHSHETDHDHIHGPNCDHVEYQHAHHHIDRCEEHGHTEHCAHKDHQHVHTEIDMPPHIHDEKCGHLDAVKAAEVIDRTHDSDVHHDEPVSTVVAEPPSKQTEAASINVDNTSPKETPQARLSKTEEIKQPAKAISNESRNTVQSKKENEITQKEVAPSSNIGVLSDIEARPLNPSEQSSKPKSNDNQLKLSLQAKTIDQKLEKFKEFQQTVENSTLSEPIEEIVLAEQPIMSTFVQESEALIGETLDQTHIDPIETSDFRTELSLPPIDATYEQLQPTTTEQESEKTLLSTIVDVKSPSEFSLSLDIDDTQDNIEDGARLEIQVATHNSVDALDTTEYHDTLQPAIVEISTRTNDDVFPETHALIPQEQGELSIAELFELQNAAEQFFTTTQTIPQKEASELFTSIDEASEINNQLEDESEESIDLINTHHQGTLAKLFVSSAKDPEHITTRIGQVVLELLKLKQKQMI